MPSSLAPVDDASVVDPGHSPGGQEPTRRALREQAERESAARSRRSRPTAARSTSVRRRPPLVPTLALGLVGVLAGTGAGAGLSALRSAPTSTTLAADAAGTAQERDGQAAGSRSQGRDPLADDSLGSTADGAVQEPLVVSSPETDDVVPAADDDLVVIPAGMTADDLVAGVRSTTVPTFASGVFDTVPGEVPAPGDGTVKTVRVEVEQGLDVDGAAFADYVLTTLNDARSWGGDGSQTFARTESPDATFTVTLASPDSVDKKCAPLKTNGIVSCGITGNAVLNYLRWVEGSDVYGEDRESFRRYLVNHEVGHVLGNRHEPCGPSGTLAPVMMQQSGGPIACEPNGWPFP